MSVTAADEQLLRRAYDVFNARDTAGELLADTMVQHVYTISDGLVTRMEVRD